MKFIIVGGDAAGMSAASKAKRINSNLDIIVLEKTQDVSYSACGMPYNISDQNRNIEDLVVRQAHIFREKQGINLLVGHTAKSIDPVNKKISGNSLQGEDFEFTYDKLLIATGGSPVIPHIPGTNLPGVMVLKTLDDGRKIKDFIKSNKVKKAVIIGMGYIGIEMCEALHALSIDVNMVKPGSIFLPWMEKSLSEVVKNEIISNSIQLNMGQQVKEIEQNGRQLKVICTDINIDADIVLFAMGIKPNSGIAVDAGLATGINDAISVSKNLQTSNENIYAAGDCADAYNVITGEKTWVPLALRANRAGWAVADNVCGKKTELQGIVGTAVFKAFNLEIARTGLSFSEAEKFGFTPKSVVIKSRSRAHAHPGAAMIWVHLIADKDTGKLLGCQMVGKEGVAHRINAIAVALHNFMTVEQFSQTDLAYAPPFSPVWDPMLTAANQLVKKL
ncbi:flavoprotein oxidoreductase [Candidatus Magnetomorum sp. HK-1]|nr:flavoprotein oxidoreductase [Candidatus Magnetomorum sp. HK-1]